MATREGETPTGERRWTLEEFGALPEQDEHVLELVAGRIVREPRPQRPHGNVVARLCRILLDYADAHGGVATADVGFILGRDPPTVRGPDVAYLRKDRSYGDPTGWYEGAPDLAVEVISPSNAAAEMQQKVAEYFDANARQVWVIYPRTRTVVVHSSASEARALREGDRIDGGEAFPGLSVPVSDCFGG
jgi:Uma2 family endonuclease